MKSLFPESYCVDQSHYTDGATGEDKSQLTNSGAHGCTEVLYGFSSAGNNNGSAFAGLNASENQAIISLIGLP